MEHQSNTAALEATIKALPGLSAEHAALVAHCRTLAEMVDTYPTEHKVHSEYREVLRRLMLAGQAEKVDEFAALLDRLGSEAEKLKNRGKPADEG